MAQDGPKMAQDGPRWPHDCPNTAQDSSRWPQDDPRSAQDDPNMASTWAKMAVRCHNKENTQKQCLSSPSPVGGAPPPPDSPDLDHNENMCMQLLYDSTTQHLKERSAAGVTPQGSQSGRTPRSGAAGAVLNPIQELSKVLFRWSTPAEATTAYRTPSELSWSLKPSKTYAFLEVFA